MTDLDYIHQAIIESKGCEGDDFPYEYTVVPEFTITINPEDWTFNVGSGYAKAAAQVDIETPAAPIIFGEINGQYCWSEFFAFVTISGEVFSAEISFNGAAKGHINEIRLDIYDVLPEDPVAETLVLSFTNMLFLGQPKE